MNTGTRKEISLSKSESLQFKADGKALLAALLPLGGIAPLRSPRPILSHIRLASSRKGLELSATDLDMWVTAKTGVPGGEGALAVPAEAFLQIVREAGEAEVSVSSREAGGALFEVGKDRYEVACLPAEEFPACAEKVDGPKWGLPGGVLPKLLKRTSFAAARERTRYALNGVYWSSDGGELELVATDGRRLALARAKVKGNGKASGILPLRTAAQISQFAEEPLSVVVGERAVELKTASGSPEFTLVSRLMEGQYPSYRSVIPKDYPNVALAKAPELLTAFRRAALLSQESRAVRLVFRKGTLTLSGGDPGRGQTQIVVDLEYQGAEVDLRLNPDFVMEGLKSWGEGPVRWEIRDAVSPCVLREGDDYLYVVLPITLD